MTIEVDSLLLVQTVAALAFLFGVLLFAGYRMGKQRIHVDKATAAAVVENAALIAQDLETARKELQAVQTQMNRLKEDIDAGGVLGNFEAAWFALTGGFIGLGAGLATDWILTGSGSASLDGTLRGTGIFVAIFVVTLTLIVPFLIAIASLSRARLSGQQLRYRRVLSAIVRSLLRASPSTAGDLAKG